VSKIVQILKMLQHPVTVLPFEVTSASDQVPEVEKLFIPAPKSAIAAFIVLIFRM
jgi:hypothetical protein